MNNELNERNFILYAAKCYDVKLKDTDEFYEDLKRFQYIKRLLVKYRDTGELRERLILNHIITLYNVFSKEATVMLFFKLEGLHKYLKPFIVSLGYMSEIISYSDKRIYSSDIELDPVIVNKLREL